MHNTIIRWSPDTCGCVLLYEADTDTDENIRTHEFQRAEVVCPDHIHLQGAAVYDSCLAENQGKNLVLDEIQKVVGSPIDDLVGDYKWEFRVQAGKRVLEVSHTRVMGRDKAELQQRLARRRDIKILTVVSDA